MFFNNQTEFLSKTKTTMDFLPYSFDSILHPISLRHEVIRYLHFLIKLSINALENFFEHKKYYEFDAQVGDNLCQIRGYINVLLAKERSYFVEKVPEIYDNLNELEGKLVLLYNVQKENSNTRQSKKNKALSKKLTANQFLHELNCLYEIPEWVLYLTFSFFLKLYNLKNEEGVSLSINFHKICLDMGICKNFARKIVFYFQKLVSIWSIDFIKGLCVKSNLFKLLVPVNKLINTDDNGRYVLPCYIVMKIIMEHIKISRTLIFLRVKKYKNASLFDVVYALFHYKNGSLVLREDFELFKDEPVIFMDGVSIDANQNKCDFFRSIEKINLEKIILANMAIHPQYSGRKLLDLKDNPYVVITNEMKNGFKYTDSNKCWKRFNGLFVFYLNLAKKLGCQREDNRTLYIKHICCSTINDVFEYMDNKFPVAKASLKQENDAVVA